MSKPYRVIVWSPSNLGSACIREILRLPDFELVGVLGYSEAKHGKDITPEELYARIPIVTPTTTELVFPVNEEKGIYKLKSVDDFNSFHEWSWEQICNFAGSVV